MPDTALQYMASWFFYRHSLFHFALFYFVLFYIQVSFLIQHIGLSPVTPYCIFFTIMFVTIS